MEVKDDDLASVLASNKLLKEKNKVLEQALEDAEDFAATAKTLIELRGAKLADCRRRLSDQEKMIKQLQQNNDEADEMMMLSERRHEEIKQRWSKENEELRQTNNALQTRIDNLNAELVQLRSQYEISSLLEDEIGAAGPRGQGMLKPSMQF